MWNRASRTSTIHRGLNFFMLIRRRAVATHCWSTAGHTADHIYIAKHMNLDDYSKKKYTEQKNLQSEMLLYPISLSLKSLSC